MRKLLTLLVTLTIVASTDAGQGKQSNIGKPATHTLAIVGATVIDVNGKANISDAVVVIEGNKIKAVGPRARIKVPTGAEMIDAKGKYLIPGLIDTHTHSAYDG